MKRAGMAMLLAIALVACSKEAPAPSPGPAVTDREVYSAASFIRTCQSFADSIRTGGEDLAAAARKGDQEQVQALLGHLDRYADQLAETSRQGAEQIPAGAVSAEAAPVRDAAMARFEDCAELATTTERIASAGPTESVQSDASTLAADAADVYAQVQAFADSLPKP